MLKQHKGFAFSLPSNKLFPFHLCGERQCLALKLRSLRERDPLFFFCCKGWGLFHYDKWRLVQTFGMGSGGSSRETHSPFPAAMRRYNCLFSHRLWEELCQNSYSLSRATSGFAIYLPRTARCIICILGWLISYLGLSSTMFLVNNSLCNTVKPTGYFMWLQLPKHRTILRYALQRIYIFVCSSEQTAMNSLQSINWLIIINQTVCVHSAIRAECLNILQVHLSLSMFKNFTRFRTGNTTIFVQSNLVVKIIRDSQTGFVCKIWSLRSYHWSLMAKDFSFTNTFGDALCLKDRADAIVHVVTVGEGLAKR